MKNLKNYINEALRFSQSEYIDKSNCLYDKHINEWKLDGDYVKDFVMPKNKHELRELVIKRLKENTEEPDFSDVLTNKIDDMALLFSGLQNSYLKTAGINSSKIKKLDLRSWKVNKVVDFYGMFGGCENLEIILGIDDWNVNNGLDFSHMFTNCKKLRNIDINKWTFKHKDDDDYLFRMDRMFTNCDESIIPSWYDKKMWAGI